MLNAVCEDVLAQYMDRNHAEASEDLRVRVRLAFDEGSDAAKANADASRCRFSAVDAPDEFLAWLAGFRCCECR
jgi:hypothetical protein